MKIESSRAKLNSPGSCCICDQPDIDEINAEIADGLSQREIAEDRPFHESTVGEHISRCLEPDPLMCGGTPKHLINTNMLEGLRKVNRDLIEFRRQHGLTT